MRRNNDTEYSNLQKYMQEQCEKDFPVENFIIDRIDKGNKTNDLDPCGDQIQYFFLCSEVYIICKALSIIFNIHSIIKCMAIIFVKINLKPKTKK